MTVKLSRLASACVILSLLSTIADAQETAPFDMTPERPPESTLPPVPQLVFPPPPADEAGPASPPSPLPQPPDEVPAETVRRKYVLPGPEFTLAGEYDRRTWSVYLTEAEASGPAKLRFAYQNAVVVAPEASELTVAINGHRLAAENISSPDAVRSVVFDIPRAILHAGANQIDIRASQRHRTDCDVRSTYDLWATLDPKQTYLEFGGLPAEATSIGETVRAIGFDEAGGTTFQILMPALGQPGVTSPVMRLVQGLALMSGMPNQSFAFSASEMPKAGPGRMGIVIGTAAELQPVFPNLPAAAGVSAIATVVPDAQGAGQLVLSGPSWEAIRGAIDTLVQATGQPADVRRDVISTQRWAVPDAPLFFGGEKVALSQLGVETVDFPGRRLRVRFNIAVPADFYANAYGEAVLLLDAAFASNVKPGSHIDVYINDNIASTVPITSSHGGILRHLPIKVPLRHIRPGVNAIAIETVLLAREDEECMPGATASKEPRFALFDTSEWQMPRFARIGSNPNLSALSGVGFPYNQSADPIVLSVDRFDADAMSAAATVLGRLALVSGRMVPVDVAANASAVGERNAIFLGTMSQMAPKVLTQLGISATSAMAWRTDGRVETQASDTATTFDQWRSRVSGGAWRGQISALQEWVIRNFDLSFASLQFLPQSEQEFAPTARQSFLVAQSESPQGLAAWTVIAAPTSTDLRDGATAIAREVNWSRIAGRLTLLDRTGAVSSLPANRFGFVKTVPPSLGNYRLIAANWLSTNILSYAVAFIALSLLLGIVTASLLSSTGRRR